MSTAPKFISLDRRSTDKLSDMARARVSLLRQVINFQHSLMSGWGYPPLSRTAYIAATNGGLASQVVSYRVPPGVTHADVSILIEGPGVVTITSSSDAIGTTLRSTSSITETPIENAVWHSTEGVYDDESAESGRALQLVSSASWSHQDVDVTVSLNASFGLDMMIYALVFRPVHVPR